MDRRGKQWTEPEGRHSIFSQTRSSAFCSPVLGDAQQIYRTLRAAQESLHEDALDVFANVSHFVADSDVRQRDEDYRATQARTMRELVDALRRRASREQLLTFSFLD